MTRDESMASWFYLAEKAYMMIGVLAGTGTQQQRILSAWNVLHRVGLLRENFNEEQHEIFDFFY